MHKIVAVVLATFMMYVQLNVPLLRDPPNTGHSTVSLCMKEKFCIGVSDCDSLRLLQFWNITYDNYKNSHNNRFLIICDEKLMGQVIFETKMVIVIMTNQR